MFKFQTRGLEYIYELSEMFTALNGIQFYLHRDAAGEIDPETSMRELEREVDRKLHRFSHNPLVKQFGDSAKRQLRQKIAEYADRARRGMRPFGNKTSVFRPI